VCWVVDEFALETLDCFGSEEQHTRFWCFIRFTLLCCCCFWQHDVALMVSLFYFRSLGRHAWDMPGILVCSGNLVFL
jgi:hypothetical protein